MRKNAQRNTPFGRVDFVSASAANTDSNRTAVKAVTTADTASVQKDAPSVAMGAAADAACGDTIGTGTAIGGTNARCEIVIGATWRTAL